MGIDPRGLANTVGDYEARLTALRERCERLEAGISDARINLAALIAIPNLRAHPSDIPSKLNDGDRECVALAFNRLTELLPEGKG